MWSGTTFYTNAAPASTVTLAAVPEPLSFSAIGLAGFTLSWPANNNPNTTQYQATISTNINFGTFTSSLTTTGLSAPFNGLTGNTTYYARVRALNSASTPSAYALGVVLTSVGVITISANRLTNVWYNNLAAVFNAQGAVTYHYAVTVNPTDQPTAADPVFDGSALSATVPQGVSYFHVWGRDGVGVSLGYAHFGPVDSDALDPLVTAIAAQVSAADATAISDGGTTEGPTPHFTWPATVSASPVVGYAFSLSQSALVVPTTVNTTLTFIDSQLSAPGIYYAKIRALNLAGTLGPVISMSINYDDVPAVNSLILKRNYFRPLRGECVSVDAPSLRREAREQQRSLLHRAGITIPHVWPHVDAR